jgi:hypothetical protein
MPRSQSNRAFPHILFSLFLPVLAIFVAGPGFFTGAVLPGKDDYSHRWFGSRRDG